MCHCMRGHQAQARARAFRGIAQFITDPLRRPATASLCNNRLITLQPPSVCSSARELANFEALRYRESRGSHPCQPGRLAYCSSGQQDAGGGAPAACDDAGAANVG